MEEIIGKAVQTGLSIYGLWKQNKINAEMKIKATSVAEEYVVSMWGLRSGGTKTIGGCGLPSTGEDKMPVPGESYYCDGSFGHMLEQCDTAGAASFAAYLAQTMQANASQDAYFKRWFDQYGQMSIQQMNRWLSGAAGPCAKAIGAGTVTAPTTGASTGSSGAGTSILGSGSMWTIPMLIVGGLVVLKMMKS